MGKLVYLSIINDPTISDEQKAKEKEYKAYIDNHISNIAKAWAKFKYIKNIKSYLESFTKPTALKIIYDNMNVQIMSHDASKFSIEEWEPYRMHFHPISEEEKIQSTAAFEDAWEHHYMHNPHHWDYWAVTGKDNMPLSYCIEMWCDWIAVSMTKGGDAYSWFRDQLDNNKIELGDKQKEWTETVLKLYYNEDK